MVRASGEISRLPGRKTYSVEVIRVGSVDYEFASIHFLTRFASPIRVFFPHEFNRMITTDLLLMFACMTRQRPASLMKPVFDTSIFQFPPSGRRYNLPRKPSHRCRNDRARNPRSSTPGSAVLPCGPVAGQRRQSACESRGTHKDIRPPGSENRKAKGRDIGSA